MLQALHAPTLYVSVIVVMASASVLMTLVAFTQRTYRGYGWWVLAQWLNLGGALSLALREQSPWWLLVSVILGLQWPITMLRGLRRFYARSDLPLPPQADLWVLTASIALWAWVWGLDPGDIGARVAAFSIGSMACHVYAAWMISRIREWRRSPALKAFMVLMLAGMAAQWPRLHDGLAHWGQPVADPQHFANPSWLLLVMTVGVIYAVYLGLLLTFERSDQEMQESRQQLRQMVDLDMLTQLPNRRHFLESARDAVRRQDTGVCSLALIDIDRLAHINETHGQEMGDRAVKLVAAVAGSMLRGQDIVGRLGGDQFVILLPDTPQGDAQAVVARMARQILDQQRAWPHTLVSISAGLVQLEADEALEPCLQRLTLTLAEAKRLGRQRLVIGCLNNEGEQVFTAIRPLGPH